MAFVSRDAEFAAQEGSQDITQVSSIRVWPLAQLREMGVEQAARLSVTQLEEQTPASFWIHLSADVLNDALMTAVDYRLPGGLSWPESEMLLQTLLRSGRAVGMTVTIYNPSLDADGSISARFTGGLIKALTF